MGEERYNMNAIIRRINEAKSREPEPDYNIGESVEQLGYLDPLKVDAKGRMIDGAHRIKVAENWPAFKLDHINTDEKYLIAMFTSNYHRRQMTPEEKAAILDGIAEITGWTPKEIADHLGVSEMTVSRYLSDKYKDPEMQRRRQKREEKREQEQEEKTVPSVNRLLTEPEKPAEESSKKKKAPRTDTNYRLSSTGAKQPTQPDEKITFTFGDTPNEPQSRFIKGVQHLSLLIPANHPAIEAIGAYCYDKEVYLCSVVERAVIEFLKREGYLPPSSNQS